MTRTGNQKFAQHIHHSGQVFDPDDAATTVQSSLGVAQTVSLLGPFHVSHDDVVPADLIPVPVGSLVIDIQCLVSEPWDEDVLLSIADPDPGWGLALAQFAVSGDWWQGPNMCAPRVLGAEGSGATANLVLLNGGSFVSQGDPLKVNLSAVGTEGEADIYALIATPS